MKVRVAYSVPVVKEIEMSEEDYCHLYANFQYGGYLPAHCYYGNTTIEPATEEDKKQLDHWIWEKQKKDREEREMRNKELT